MDEQGDARPDQGAPRGGYPGFPGRVGRTFAGSEGWWPPRAEAPEGAPNVVVVLVDDLGYSDVGCYGSEIATPNVDRLAAEGLRFTDFHSTPMCSPTRAGLLTGVNHHRAGVGTVAHLDPGFPGYAEELDQRAATMAEVLRANGYATFMVGKWHLSKDSDLSDAGPRDSWPCQRGFDRYYGVLGPFTNLHQPNVLTEDNHHVQVDEYPEDYFFTDDITDRAIAMIRERKASRPDQPFFLYLSHGAVHAPLHAKTPDIEAQRGRYEAGWDAVRQARYERQVATGVVPEGTRLAPRNQEEGDDVRPWDELSEDEQRLFARHMEVYAAMVANVDENLGRLMDALDELGERNDTIVVFTSDNGASREGEACGTSAYYVHLLQGDDVEADLARIDELGGPTTTPHYPRGWAMVGNTPFRLYKINTHAGGHTVPFVVSWPRGFDRLGVADRGGLRRQWTHVNDVLPTLLEVIGIEHPAADPDADVLSMDGASFAATLADPEAGHAHTEQHEEINGHRSYYRDGVEIVTRHQAMTSFDDEWELYDLRVDPTELDDLADQQPEVVAELAEAWEAAAWANQVYPLDEGSQLKYVLRPERSRSFAEPVRIVRGTPTLERWRSVQLIWFRSYRVEVELAVAEGDEGVLVAHGDQGGGYLLAVEDGHLRYVHNDGRGRLRSLDGGPLPPGDQVVTLDVAAPGQMRWDVELLVGGEGRGRLEGVPQLFGVCPFEGIDVGIDRRSPVDWDLRRRRGTFPWSGHLAAVTYTPGELAPDAPENLIPMLRELGLAYE